MSDRHIYGKPSRAVSPFAALGIEPTNSHAVVKAAYRAKCKATHPDHGGDAADFRAVRAAWLKLDTQEKLNRLFIEWGRSTERTAIAVFKVGGQTVEFTMDGRVFCPSEARGFHAGFRAA